MPSKNQKLLFKAAERTNTANTAANTAANNANASAADPTTVTDGVESDTTTAPTNNEILKAIQSLKEDFGKKFTDMLEAVNDLKGDLASQSGRIREAEERVSQTEDDVAALQGKIKQLEQTVETLKDKVQDQEDRNRRSNLRLVGLPEKTEGSDLCSFLEDWLPKALGDTFTAVPVIERAHRIGQVNPNQSLRCRTVIVKFLNYKDREKTLRAATRMKEVKYGNQRVSFFPDLSAETRQRQRLFDGVKIQLRAMNIRYGMLYPAHLIITHDDKRLIFKTVSEAEDYIQKVQPASRSSSPPTKI